MAHDPALPNLTPEEQDELARLREEYLKASNAKSPAEAQQDKSRLPKILARIGELTRKGRPREIKG